MDGASLSQDEINALLAGMAMGEVPQETSNENSAPVADVPQSAPIVTIFESRDRYCPRLIPVTSSALM